MPAIEATICELVVPPRRIRIDAHVPISVLGQTPHKSLCNGGQIRTFGGAVLHIVIDGQLEVPQMTLCGFQTTHHMIRFTSSGSGILRIGVQIHTKRHTRRIAPLNVLHPFLVILRTIILPVPASDNGEVDTCVSHGRPVDVAVMLADINASGSTFAWARPTDCIKPIECLVAAVVHDAA